MDSGPSMRLTPGPSKDPVSSEHLGASVIPSTYLDVMTQWFLKQVCSWCLV
jgi:hypothetical protein